MVSEKELIIQFAQRINHLLAVLEPAKRLDDDITKLNSAFGIRFRHYVKYITLVHSILGEIGKLSKMGRKKYEKKKDFPLTPKHYLRAIEYIKKAKELLDEILGVVRKIYNDESKAYNIEVILNKHLIEIINNVNEGGDYIHPINTGIDWPDKRIIQARKDIVDVSREIRTVYVHLAKMYGVLRREEGLMASFYSKVQSRLEHFKKFYEMLPAGGFSGYEWQEKQGLVKQFADMEKESEKRFEELKKLKSESIPLINEIKDTDESAYKSHKKICEGLSDLKDSLKKHSAAEKLVF